MFWLALVVGGVLGSTTRHHGMPALERIFSAAAYRQLCDQRVDGFIAGVLMGLGLQIRFATVSLSTPASLGLLASFAVASTIPTASATSLAARLVRGVVAAAAGLALGAAL